ncbi:unnamed protein product [Blepharisma stoltei]|uniref:Uncharacterized protein n=1 Tax=Blepharisma stoltei TaxID=1481888 RepID=A0AAU9IPL8_9CILI|nr:unnamed protein product [Blepharisma stoltei]
MINLTHKLLRRYEGSLMPKDVVIKRFQLKTATAHVFGVERWNGAHALWLNDALGAISPKCIITQLPADLPWFIKADENVNLEWTNFLKTGKGRFLCSPRPKYLQDIILNAERLSHFMIGAVLNSPEELTNIKSIMYTNTHDSFIPEESDPMKPDSFTTTLLWAASNPSRLDCLIPFDLPELIYRDQIARTIDLNTLREALKTLLGEFENEKKYDLRFVNPQIFINNKVNYMAEIIKQTLITYQDNTIVVAVENKLVDPLTEAWKNVPYDSVSFDEFLTIPKMDKDTTFSNYIEKHVLLDILLGTYISQFYIKNKLFPYSAHGAVGSEGQSYSTALEFWKNFFMQHSEELKKTLAIYRKIDNSDMGRKFKKMEKKIREEKIRDVEIEKEAKKYSKITSDEEVDVNEPQYQRKMKEYIKRSKREQEESD